MCPILPVTRLEARDGYLNMKHSRQRCIQNLKNGSPNIENTREDEGEALKQIDITSSQNKVVPKFKSSENDMSTDDFKFSLHVGHDWTINKTGDIAERMDNFESRH